jgi:hypothetical protein
MSSWINCGYAMMHLQIHFWTILELETKLNIVIVYDLANTLK